MIPDKLFEYVLAGLAILLLWCAAVLFGLLDKDE